MQNRTITDHPTDLALFSNICELFVHLSEIRRFNDAFIWAISFHYEGLECLLEDILHRTFFHKDIVPQTQANFILFLYNLSLFNPTAKQFISDKAKQSVKILNAAL